MIVLDTNVLSELQKPEANRAVVSWAMNVKMEEMWLCTPVIMEQAHGAELHFLKSGSSRYRDTQARAVAEFASRILIFDRTAAQSAGRIRATRHRMGRPISVGDAMIAGICLASDATLATRNVRDFSDLDLRLINPFEAA